MLFPKFGILRQNFVALWKQFWNVIYLYQLLPEIANICTEKSLLHNWLKLEQFRVKVVEHEA